MHCTGTSKRQKEEKSLVSLSLSLLVSLSRARAILPDRREGVSGLDEDDVGGSQFNVSRTPSRSG